MEFMDRGAMQSSAPARGAQNGGGKKHNRWAEGPMWLRIVWVVLLFSATVVIAAIALLLYIGGPKEVNHVDNTKQQAVFLTNGQVYFGKINSINSKYIDLRGIYYLNVNQQEDQSDQTNVQNNISLVKLGCELHRPTDQMLINREQVSFWENLKSDGPVSDAIADWIKKNPNGQKKCTTTSNSTTQSTSQP